MRTSSKFYDYPYSSRNVLYRQGAIDSFFNRAKPNFEHFENLTPDRAEEIDAIVAKWRTYFQETEVQGYGPRMTFTAERLTTSAKKYGIFDTDEKLYFFIKMVDPDFCFLEAFESANTKEEYIALCKKNFHEVAFKICKETAAIENEANGRFKFYEPDELWSRNLIDKDIELEDSPRR